MSSNPNIIYITENFYYTVYKIKNRVIFAPCEELKKAQKYLLNAIKWVYPLKNDVLNSAKIHTGKKWVLKIDIKNFYNSVPTQDIMEVLTDVSKKIKDFNLIYNFNLATVDGKLPTGAITSAHIANACFKPVEKNIRNFCNILDIDFTRYVDDLIFSSDEKQVLKIAEKRVNAILNSYGYKVNKGKTKYISDNKQQNILGLVVNYNRVRLPKKYKKEIRAKIHNFVMYLAKSNNIKYPTWSEAEINSLQGSIFYLKHIEPKTYQKIKTYYRNLLKNMYLKGDKIEKFID